MKMLSSKISQRISFFILYMGITISAEEEVKKCSSIIPGPKRSYFVGGTFTCCNDMLLDHTIKPKNEHWRKCLSRQHGNFDDDIPSTMWNAYKCELVNAGNLSENFNYQEFEMFFTKKYPQEIRDQLLANSSLCEVSEDMNIGERLQKFEECFLKAEESFCHNLAGTTPSPLDVPNGPNFKTFSGLCETVENLRNPNHSFPAFAQPCCKGQELPYSLFDLFMDFDRFDAAREVTTCVQNLKTKLIELNYTEVVDENLDKQLTKCQVACVHEADGLMGKYNSNFNDLLNFKMKSISNSTKEKLVSIIMTYNPQFQLHGTNESVPMESAEAIISKMDETNQILNYCKFQYEAAAEAYRALYQHCYNTEYGKQFREEILDSSNF